MLQRLGFALIAVGFLSGCQMGRWAPDDEIDPANMTARERAEADLNRMYYADVPAPQNTCPPRSSVMYGGVKYCVGSHHY